MDFTFCAIDVNVTNLEKQLMLAEVLDIPDNLYHENGFRWCRMLGIYNGGGRLGGPVKGRSTSKGKFKYTTAGERCPTIQSVLAEKIFPFMNPIGRVTILRTRAGSGLNVHLDTLENEIGTRQHKYRLVLNGEIDKLFFIDKNNEKVFMPNEYNSYVLDGSHPHSIDPADEEKITLCVGAPWHGEDNELYSSLVENSNYSIKVSRPNVIDPKWVDPFFKYKTIDENIRA